MNRPLAFACVLLLNACSDWMPLSSPTVQAERLKAIESETGLALPASSVVMEYDEPQSMFNRLWVAKVRIPEESFAKLKETILRKEDISQNVGPDKSGLPESINWWKPIDIEFTRGYEPGDGDLYVKVVASKESGERMLYIYGVP